MDCDIDWASKFEIVIALRMTGASLVPVTLLVSNLTIKGKVGPFQAVWCFFVILNMCQASDNSGTCRAWALWGNAICRYALWINRHIFPQLLQNMGEGESVNIHNYSISICVVDFLVDAFRKRTCCPQTCPLCWHGYQASQGWVKAPIIIIGIINSSEYGFGCCSRTKRVLYPNIAAETHYSVLILTLKAPTLWRSLDSMTGSEALSSTDSRLWSFLLRLLFLLQTKWTGMVAGHYQQKKYEELIILF